MGIQKQLGSEQLRLAKIRTCTSISEITLDVPLILLQSLIVYSVLKVGKGDCVYCYTLDIKLTYQTSIIRCLKHTYGHVHLNMSRFIRALKAHFKIKKTNRYHFSAFVISYSSKTLLAYRITFKRYSSLHVFVFVCLFVCFVLFCFVLFCFVLFYFVFVLFCFVVFLP